MSGLNIGLIIIALVLAANLPFFSARLLLIGPRMPQRHLGWRLLEALLWGAVVVSLAMVLESRIGQRHPQGWEFYAVVGSLLLTFAFPGFVWRYLRRHR